MNRAWGIAGCLVALMAVLAAAFLLSDRDTSQQQPASSDAPADLSGPQLQHAGVATELLGELADGLDERRVETPSAASVEPPHEVPEPKAEAAVFEEIGALKVDMAENLRMVMANALDAEYEALFLELGLPPEQQEALRAILLKYRGDPYRIPHPAYRGSFTVGEPTFEEAVTESSLRAELAALFTPAQLEAFERFEADMPYRAAHAMHEARLAKTSLPDTTIARIAEVLTEESLVTAPPAPDEIAPFFRQLLEANDAAYARLSVELSAEDLAEVERMFEQDSAKYEAYRAVLIPEGEE